MATIKITLETLYDILRNEKKREDLQKLEETFYIDLISYLREKKALLDMKKEDTSIFAAGEKEKLEYEQRSIKRILKEIYEKREKKIIDIALNKSRTGSDIIDTSAMMREEKEFYEQLLNTMDQYRKGVLLNLFQGQLPATAPTPFTRFETPASFNEDAGSEEEAASELPSAPPERSSLVHEGGIVGGTGAAKGESVVVASVAVSPASGNDSKAGMMQIRFIHPVPRFVWKDMKVYGPFDAGESTEIYTQVAELLIRKGRAEKA